MRRSGAFASEMHAVVLHRAICVRKSRIPHTDTRAIQESDQLLVVMCSMPGPQVYRARMAREGRSLEQLVSLLEQFADATDATIESPGFIRSPDDGEKPREVDVLVRRRVGTVDILILVECRDRSPRQSVDWIEQIDSKRRSLNASAAVAVSSSGFTSGAVAAAARLGIDLRSIDEISLEDFSSWVTWVDMLVIRRRAELNEVEIDFGKNVDPPDLLLDPSAKCFVAEEDGASLNAGEVWDRVATAPDSQVYANLAAGEIRDVKVHATFALKGHGLRVVWNEIDLAVESIRYIGRVWIEETNQPMRPRMYSSPSGEQMGKVLEANVDGKTLQMFVDEGPSGEMRFGAAVNGAWLAGELPDQPWGGGGRRHR